MMNIIKTFSEFINESSTEPKLENKTFVEIANEYLDQIAEVGSYTIDYCDDGHPLNDGSIFSDADDELPDSVYPFMEGLTGKDFWAEVTRYIDYYAKQSDISLFIGDVDCKNLTIDSDSDDTADLFNANYRHIFNLQKIAILINLKKWLSTDYLSKEHGKKVGDIFNPLQNKKIDTKFNLAKNSSTLLKDIPEVKGDDYINTLKKLFNVLMEKDYPKFTPDFAEFFDQKVLPLLKRNL